MKPPTPEAKKSDDEGDDTPKPVAPKVVIEEPEDEWIPPVDETLWYDYQTYKNPALNKDDPILLALMVKGKDDVFTL